MFDSKDNNGNNVAVATFPEPDYSHHSSTNEPTAGATTTASGPSAPIVSGIGTHLLWRNINMTVKGNKTIPDKKILRDVWGSVSSEILAILGPSGAGKTSLLNVLAGRVHSSRKIQISYEMYMNGERVYPDNDVSVRKKIAFVEQHDTLFIAATPREAIRFSGRLRLPKTTTDEELETLTTNMLKELNLETCADTIVGGERLKGISGGERKRAAIGVELVTKPSIVYLDEPTSGLDSHSAKHVIQVLKNVVKDTGASVILTIHQPNSEITDMLDRLILLKAGRVMYQGREDDVVDYFAERSHVLPPKYNPADFIMTIAQTVPEEELMILDYFPSEKDSKNIDIEEAKALIESAHGNASVPVQHVSGFTEFLCLVKRDMKSIKRNKMILGARMMLTTFMSLVVGLLFQGVGNSDSAQPVNVQSQFGAVILATMLAMFSTALPTLLVFPDERPVFIREFATNHYSVLTYFMSRLTMEAFITAIQIVWCCVLLYFLIQYQMPFMWFFLIMYALAMSSTAIAMMIGSGVTDPKLSVEFLPMTLVPQILFAGFFVAPDLIPIWLRWLQYVFPLTYGVKLALIHEFDRDCGSPAANKGCNSVLVNTNTDPDDAWWYWLALAGIFTILRLGALLLLRRKAHF